MNRLSPLRDFIKKTGLNPGWASVCMWDIGQIQELPTHEHRSFPISHMEDGWMVVSATSAPQVGAAGGFLTFFGKKGLKWGQVAVEVDSLGNVLCHPSEQAFKAAMRYVERFDEAALIQKFAVQMFATKKLASKIYRLDKVAVESVAAVNWHKRMHSRDSARLAKGVTP